MKELDIEISTIIYRSSENSEGCQDDWNECYSECDDEKREEKVLQCFDAHERRANWNDHPKDRQIVRVIKSIQKAEEEKNRQQTIRYNYHKRWHFFNDG